MIQTDLRLKFELEEFSTVTISFFRIFPRFICQWKKNLGVPEHVQECESAYLYLLHPSLTPRSFLQPNQLLYL